jgi:hypothetical protein
LVSAALFVVLLPSIAAAQGRGIFVDAGPMIGIRFTPSAEGDPTLFSLSGSPTYEWNDLDGDRRWQPGEEGALIPSSLLRQRSKGRAAPGASAAVGVWLSQSVSLRLEGSFRSEYETTFESGSPVTTIDGRQTAAVTDISIAAGWHQGGGARRVTVGYLGGVVFRRQLDETRLSTTYRLRNTVSPSGSSFTTLPFIDTFEQTFESTSYTTGVMAGLDVAFRVSQRFAVVPQVRMVAFNQDWNVRPTIMMRWQP